MLISPRACLRDYGAATEKQNIATYCKLMARYGTMPLEFAVLYVVDIQETLRILLSHSICLRQAARTFEVFESLKGFLFDGFV